VAKNRDARLQGLAQLLSSNLQEQKRLNEEQKRLNASVQGLQQKLDALKSLERNMIERNR
jgi:cell shape-determining protein MreC